MYPEGYIQIATDRQMLDGVSYDENAYISRRDVAMIFSNSLTQPLWSRAGYSEKFEMFDGTNENSLRTLEHDLFKLK